MIAETRSLAVVISGPDAAAGSMPSFLNSTGTAQPQKPETVIEQIIERGHRELIYHLRTQIVDNEQITFKIAFNELVRFV